MTAPRTISGSHAVVTGAGSGIGRGIALALAAAGADVVVSDIEHDAAERVAGEVRAAGREAVAVRTDVSQLAEVERLADVAYDAFGSVEILVNNAGVALRPFRASWNTSYEDFRWVLGVNLWGVLHGHLAFTPRMVAATGFRHVVNTSSVSNVVDSRGASAYAASKGGVASFSIAAAAELAPEGVGLTILMPGHVATSLGTSDRLRPESERSEGRDVTPFSNPLTQFMDAAREGGDPRASELSPSDVAINTPIDPSDVGRRVVRAIEDNELFCLTHEPPVEGMRQRNQQMIDSYRPL